MRGDRVTIHHPTARTIPPGFRPFHKQKQLGLNWSNELWPLDHSKRINPKTKGFA